jgi:hypothetical protein
MMWYSELFIFTQLCELMGCSKVVESGRATGFGTEVLAKYFEDNEVEIVSVEKKPDTENAAIAERKLGEYDGLDLRYGDSRTVLPSIVDESTGVLIDGPKGDDALVLALEILDTEDPLFVAIHDLHRDTFYRDLSELLFNNRLYTDDDLLVERFQEYDRSYFEWQKSHNPKEEHSGPYLKNGVKSTSYGPSLGVFFNGKDPFDKRIRANYLDYLEKTSPDLISLIGSRLRDINETGGVVEQRFSGMMIRLGQKLFN